MPNDQNATGRKKTLPTTPVGGLLGAIVGGIAFSEMFDGAGSLFSWQWITGACVGGALGSVLGRAFGHPNPPEAGNPANSTVCPPEQAQRQSTRIGGECRQIEKSHITAPDRDICRPSVPPESTPTTTSTTAHPRRWRDNLLLVELVEIPVLAILWFLFIFTIDPSVRQLSPLQYVLVAVGAPAIFLGFWGTYLGYIRVARWGGPLVDIGLWVVVSLVTAGTTFLAWTILDINRRILVTFAYRGAIPPEYAWSMSSKAARKQWEAKQTRGQARPSSANLPSEDTARKLAEPQG